MGIATGEPGGWRQSTTQDSISFGNANMVVFDPNGGGDSANLWKEHLQLER